MNKMAELVGRKAKNIIIADTVREQITSGKLAGGARLLSDNDFARKYKINERTVASGLNILVQEGLLERIPRRGTFVTKNFGNQKISSAVGMVILSREDVYGEIFRNIAKGFLNNDLFPVLINKDVIIGTSYDNSSVIKFLNILNSEQFRPYGFIIDGSFQFPFQFLKENIDNFHNIVFVNRYQYNEKLKNSKYALVDFVEAGRIAARHFIAQGYTKVACLTSVEKHYVGIWSSHQAQIMQGFAEVCRGNNIEFNEEVFWKLLHGAPVPETVNALLSSTDRPDAIFTSHSDAFLRYNLMPLLKNAKDIELLGLYNTHHAEECNFSSICIHEEKIAENAIKLLSNQTNKKEILIKPELILRS